MNKEKILAILDKNIDQEGMLKDLVAEFVEPKVIEFKAKVISKEIDLIKGTEIDNALIADLADKLLAYIKQ